MILKTAAIETSRINPCAVVVGIHPGTVDTPLSKPFQKNVPQEALFKPEYAAQKILEVIDRVNPSNSVKCFAWDHTEIPS